MNELNLSTRRQKTSLAIAGPDGRNAFPEGMGPKAAMADAVVVLPAALCFDTVDHARGQENKAVLSDRHERPVSGPQASGSCETIMQAGAAAGFERQLPSETHITGCEGCHADIQRGEKLIEQRQHNLSPRCGSREPSLNVDDLAPI
jgi:hypothetical protein